MKEPKVIYVCRQSKAKEARLWFKDVINPCILAAGLVYAYTQQKPISQGIREGVQKIAGKIKKLFTKKDS